ncbi:MAG: hypothetical protein FJZ04_04455, partial [Candidatus Moranbacteria bacterium]|nr:hypothetical protein [Candidatus Moranbacteria bacterium]
PRAYTHGSRSRFRQAARSAGSRRLSCVAESKIILLQGDNSFFRKREKRAIVQDWMERQNNRNVANYYLGSDLREEAKAKILRAVGATSLFYEKELVVITLGPERSLEWEKFLAGLLDKLPQNISLIIEASYRLLRSSPLAKKVQRIAGCRMMNFEMPPKKDRAAFTAAVRSWIRENKLNLDEAAISQLIGSSRQDFWFAFTALAQALVLQKALPGGNLSQEALELWDLSEERNIFWLFDAIGRGEKARALSLLYELNFQKNLRSGEDVKAVLGFASLMARQLRQIIAVKGGISRGDAQREWQIPPFAFGKLCHQASFFKLSFLREAFLRLIKLQQNAKRGLYSPLWLLDFFVLYLISHRETHSDVS